MRLIDGFRVQEQIARCDKQATALTVAYAENERYVASEEALQRELSAEAVQSMLFEARRALGLLDGTDYLVQSRRIFVVARKR